MIYLDESKDVFNKLNLNISEENWRGFFRSSSIPFIICEMNSKLTPVKLLDANEAFCGKVHYTRLELLNMNTEIVLGTEVGSINTYYITRKNRKKAIRSKRYVISRSGNKMLFEFNWYFINLENKIVGIAALHDLTEQISFKRMLIKSEAKYKRLIEVSLDAVIICSDNNIVHANKSAVKLFGLDSEKQLLNKPLYDLFNKEQSYIFDVDLSKILTRDRKTLNFQLKIVKGDGKEIDVQATATKVEYLGKSAEQIIIRDISENAQNNDIINYLAYHDHLTGLPNRLLFNKKLFEAMKIVQKNLLKIAVICIDIDRFSKINKSFGRAIGDEVIIQASQRMVEILDGNMISRICSDEFYIFINYSEEQEIYKLMNKLRHEFSKPYYAGDREIYCSFSAGISLMPINSDSVDTLTKMADIALNYSKDNGNDMFSFYNSSMEKQHVEVVELASSIKRGLEQNEFLLYFQPQIDVRMGTIKGAEALIRWNYKNKKMLTPNQFINIAEETKQILGIGEWVLYNTCKQIRSWQDNGITPMKMSVNISPIQLQQRTFYELVLNVIKDTGILPNLLQLEITESTIINNFEIINEMFSDFRKIGISISLDDFGTGYSSLSYLKAMNIDNLKIDRSFIVDVNECVKNMAIVSNIISLAHTLGLSVTAEGIEDEDQLKFLKNAKCDYYQGYLFSEPVPKKDFEYMINDILRVKSMGNRVV